MNTRSFIRSIVVGCVAPTIFIPRFEGFKWKQEKLWTPNPAWKTAPYEITFYGGTIDETQFSQFYRDYLKLCTRDIRTLKPV